MSHTANSFEFTFDVARAEAIQPGEAVRLLTALRLDGEAVWLQTFPDAPKDHYSPKQLTDRYGQPYTVYTYHLSGVPKPGGKVATVSGRTADTGNYTLSELGGGLFTRANLARVGVFFGVNVLQPDAQRRSADTVARVAAVFLDLDGAPLPDGGFPLPPTAIIESSPGRFHVYWAVADLPLSEFTTVQKHLAGLYGGDASVSDLPRVMRLPGYWHGKTEEGFLSRLLELNEATQYSRADLLEGFAGLEDALTAAQVAETQRQAQAASQRSRAAELRAELDSGTVSSQADAQRKYGQAALLDELGKLASTGQGGRNAQLFKSAAALGECVAAGVLEQSTVESELVAVALASGLDGDEVAATLHNGLTRGLKKPRDLSGVGTRAGKVRTLKLGSSAKLIAARQRTGQAPAEGRETHTMPRFPQGTEEGTDAANALILASNNLGHRLRYTFGVGWYVYDLAHGIWREDDASLTLASQVAGQVLRTVVGQHVAHLIKQNAREEELKPALKWARDICNNWAVVGALRAAAGRPEFLASLRDWDARPDLLNCRNGVLDLPNGVLFPHAPEYLMTWQTGANFDPAAQHAYVHQLTELLRRDGRHDFLQRLVGSALYGEAPNETATVLLGEGGTGKGTLVSAVTAMLGDYAGTVAVELLLSNSQGESSTGPKPELLSLRGKRLAVAGEPPKGGRFNAGRVKGMTGNDPITARAMRSNIMVEFKPVFKLWIHTNYPINAAHDDTGMQRRLRVVPFNAKPERPYAAFKSTLENDPAARSALLNWALEGFQLWHTSGFDLSTSAEIDGATGSYWKDQNPYEKFAAACLTFMAEGEIQSGRLKTLFEEWAEENGAKMGRNVKMADLYSYLAALGCEPMRTKAGRFWYGVLESVTVVTAVTPRPQLTTDIRTREGLNQGQAVTAVTTVTRKDDVALVPGKGEL